MSSPPQVHVGALLRGRAEALGLSLELLSGAGGLGRVITSPHVQKTGLALAGFHEYLRPGRVLIFGESEIRYLETALWAERLDHGFSKGVKTTGVGDIELQQRGFPSEFFNFSENSLAFILTFAISKNHVSPVARELEGSVPTQPTAASSDESNFIGVFHNRSFVCCMVALKDSFFSEPMGKPLHRDFDSLHTQSSRIFA